MTGFQAGTHILFQGCRDNDCLAPVCKLLTTVLREPGHILLKMVFKQLIHLRRHTSLVSATIVYGH